MKAASATARSEAIETLRQPISKSEIQLSKVPKWIIPLGGDIATAVVGTLGYSLYKTRQEIRQGRAEKEALERTAQQEAQTRRIAEQQAQAERQARLAAAARAGTILGPTVNPANGHTYYLLISQSWTASEAESVSLGGHLATINDASEDTWVFNTFAAPNRMLWIGLNDVRSEGVFVWSSGE
jgi:hypothetical protein